MNAVMAQALAPFAPANSSVHRDAINQDDLYIIDLKTTTVVRKIGCKSAMAENASIVGVPVKPGQALVLGMQLQGMLREAELENICGQALEAQGSPA